ncbi:MAG: MarR family transcriptional regulator [Clostridia bacterium]|nr:MarR family transcriptional regulator [Clostridia bacterium]
MKQTNGGFLITQIKQVQGRVFERMLAEAGIDEFNGAQGRILFVLWQQEGLPIVELSARTGLAKTTLTSMLDRMEAAGHIRRTSDPHDRRVTRISLTESARALSDRYEAVSDRMADRFYEGFAGEEIDAFEGYLRRVLDNLTRGGGNS